MKRLTAVSWFMPPIVLPRSIQIARGLKTLHQRGWISDVVCAPTEAMNGTVVDRDFGALYDGYFQRHAVEYREDVSPSSWLRRSMRWMQPPDDVDEDNWIRRAGKVTLNLIQQSRPDVFVTFAQPWINHRVGLYIKECCSDLPWLVHFSDPWVDSIYLPDAGSEEEKTRRRVWREQEEAIVNAADAVVFVTRQTADLVMRKYPGDWRSKVHVVPHGFDRDTLPALPSQSADRGPLKLIHAGNIYAGKRDPQCLFQALQHLGGRDALAGRLEVAFYGNAPVETLAELKTAGLEGIVTFEGTVGYLESLRVAAAADALLLIDAAADVNVFLPSKTVDYLMLERPILGLTPENGATADVLGSTGHTVTPPGDVQALARHLAEWLGRYERGEPLMSGPFGSSDQFDIRRTIENFEAALQSAIDAVRSG
ncbi:MAG: glycosyltransferase [Geminicoccaceae bacterium]